ncbi:calcium-binding protein [Yoonia sp.]|uniref:calcium-binding protein n=1 Tax=Yoonia sp. TaxID=2212373 RepID=UPI0025E4EEBF|nr:calcium-binding protein [Yoonia sp.]
MSLFYFVTHVVVAADLERSRITDLAFVDVGGTDLLLSTTRFDGVLTAWDITGGLLTLYDSIAFDGGDQPGGTSSLTSVALAGEAGLLIGGGGGGTLQTVTIGADGSIGPTTTLPAGMAGFQHGLSITLPDSTQAIYGGLAGQSGIGRIDFTATGTLIGSQNISAPDGSFADQVAATATAAISGQTYFFTASSTQNGITSWAVNGAGDLSVIQNLGTEDGLWVSVPSAMQVAQVGGATYVILGAAGSSTLSVMEVGSDGSLIIRDHLLDSLETRFAGVTSIEIVNHNGQTYVIAGGADDGLSIFVLLEGGYLMARAHMADTTEMALDNVSAIAARGAGDGLDIFVASSSEAGLTQLRFDTGTAGVVVTATLVGGLLGGTAGNDILQGHDGDDLINGAGGDDIIRDGAGSDTLTGGAGADVFIFTADGVTDTITDFTLGEDRIDLSLWPMLRDISQLTISIQPYGMDIRYGDELLIVQSADGQMSDYRDLQTSDLIGGMRLSQDIAPGYPGPATPLPDLNPDDTPASLPVDHGAPYTMQTGLGVISDANLNHLRMALGQAGTVGDLIIGQDGNDSLSGGATADVLIGGAGNDNLSGGTGDDLIIGRAGNDTLTGGDGADVLMGGDNRDTLIGGNGHDRLDGGSGNDVLDGGAGDDMLIGGAGVDTFIFASGADTIADFMQGSDRITLDVALWTGLTSGSDLLAVYGTFDGTRATIDFGDGNVLHIDGVSNFAALGESIDLF